MATLKLPRTKENVEERCAEIRMHGIFVIERGKKRIAKIAQMPNNVENIAT